MGIFVVTGGGGPGIGSACCRALASSGHEVWVTDIDEEAAGRVAAELSNPEGALRVDVADPDSIEAGLNHVLSRSGRVDGLVNSAGITLRDPVGEESIEDFNRLFSVNVRGAWLCARAVLPSMVENRGGSIVNIASVHAHTAELTYGAYAASKAALVALTRGIAGDYGRFGVRCNSVSPGWVRDREPGSPYPDEVTRHARTRQMIPVQISPDDIGRAVAFLAGDHSRAITAVDLLVDGGRTARFTPLAEE